MREFGGEEPWMQHAACRGLDTAMWFPERGDNRSTTHVALRTCAGCPVRAPCLDYALHHTIKDGIWGGTCEHDRRPLRSRHAS